MEREGKTESSSDAGKAATNAAKQNSLLNFVQVELEHRILSGEFGMGGHVGEKIIAESLGVSRGPVREACRSLVSRGLLESVHNRGFFVRRISLEDALEIYQLRMDLESAAGARFAANGTEAQFAECKQLLDKMDKAVRLADFDAYYPLNLAFHEAIIVGGGNHRILNIHHDCLRDLHLFRARGLIAGSGMANSNQEHKAIYRALRARDGQAAASSILTHIKNGKKRMLAVLENAARAPISHFIYNPRETQP